MDKPGSFQEFMARIRKCQNGTTTSRISIFLKVDSYIVIQVVYSFKWYKVSCGTRGTRGTKDKVVQGFNSMEQWEVDENKITKFSCNISNIAHCRDCSFEFDDVMYSFYILFLISISFLICDAFNYII